MILKARLLKTSRHPKPKSITDKIHKGKTPEDLKKILNQRLLQTRFIKAIFLLTSRHPKLPKSITDKMHKGKIPKDKIPKDKTTEDN